MEKKKIWGRTKNNLGSKKTVLYQSPSVPEKKGGASCIQENWWNTKRISKKKRWKVKNLGIGDEKNEGGTKTPNKAKRKTERNVVA